MSGPLLPEMVCGAGRHHENGVRQGVRMRLPVAEWCKAQALRLATGCAAGSTLARAGLLRLPGHRQPGHAGARSPRLVRAIKDARGRRPSRAGGDRSWHKGPRVRGTSCARYRIASLLQGPFGGYRVADRDAGATCSPTRQTCPSGAAPAAASRARRRALTAMTHLAVTGTVDGKNVTWMEKVSDEQYNARPAPRYRV